MNKKAAAQAPPENDFDVSDPGARFLGADEASEILRRRGQSVSAYTLKRLRTAGGGPAYVRNIAKRVFYVHHVDETRSPLIRWAAESMSPVVTDTAGEAAAIETARAARERRGREH